MGRVFIEWPNGLRREVVRVKSDSPSHAGYYTTYRDAMKPGEEEYSEPSPGPLPGDPPLEPIRPAKGKKRVKI